MRGYRGKIPTKTRTDEQKKKEKDRQEWFHRILCLPRFKISCLLNFMDAYYDLILD